MTVKSRWLEEPAVAGFALPALMHPDATVSLSACSGHGKVVCARAVIDRGARVPEGAHISCGQAVTAGIKIDQDGILLYG